MAPDKKKILTAAALSALLFLVAAAPAAAAAGDITLSPATVPVSVFYGGAQVSLTAEIPAGSQAAVLVTGEEKELTLKKKGKRGGVLWMNVGTVSFGHIPVMYKLAFSQQPESLAPAAVLDRLDLGYEGLAERALGDDRSAERKHLFGELIKLKEKEKLFVVRTNGVAVAPSAQGPSRVTASFFLPPGAPIGAYDVRLFVFKDGEGELVSSGRVEIKRVGLVELTVDLARRHGLLYGILSVIIALAAGLLTGFAFGGGKGGH
ncbi:MAG: TIGR02186 family protein [Thermodesulfobacteriota bacterium]